MLSDDTSNETFFECSQGAKQIFEKLKTGNVIDNLNVQIHS